MHNNHDTYHWLDVDDLGELLHEHHPRVDPLRVGFTELKRLVVGLPGFAERPGHPCNEKILEHIQAAWIEAREDARGDGQPTDDSADDED